MRFRRALASSPTTRSLRIDIPTADAAERHSDPRSRRERVRRSCIGLTAAIAIAHLVLVSVDARAQANHTEHHDDVESDVEMGHEDHDAGGPASDPTRAEHAGTHPGHRALMTTVLGTSRARMGSGTSWLPDSSPMYGIMASARGWGFMVHGNVFVGYDWFGSDRGSDQFMSTNSLMGMVWHDLGPGEVMARVMLSAEPLTVGARGYPLVLQTGETASGEPLHDRQHPHDFVMELALMYSVPVSHRAALQFYVAPSGEPALGPTAFPHRVSAFSDPLAPLGHHWQDSTHIAFGVLTAGVFTRRVKLEASWFNGREPDENRWDFDLRVPDSASGRITWNPAESWSVQASYGYLASPEALDPDISVHRATASATYNRRRGPEANWATTFVFGENVEGDETGTPSFLLETNWNVDGNHVVFGRAEYVRKNGHDLVLDPVLEHVTLDVGMLGAGYVYYFGPAASLAPGLGVRGTIGFADSRLESTYGTRVPSGVMIFAQLRPAAMSM
jgi:hypothetical protein